MLAPAIAATQVELSADLYDQRIVLHGVTWPQYEMLLTMRGEKSGVRLTYLLGKLELMSPSIYHEGIKTSIARLLEAYAEQTGLALNGYGSWTIRSEPGGRGLEPDECYVLGRPGEDRPDLAIEVLWTSGGIDKLEVYRGLGVPEVWLWQNQRLQVHGLRGEAYVRLPRSELFPQLDLELLMSFVDLSDQTGAVRRYRRALELAKG